MSYHWCFDGKKLPSAPESLIFFAAVIWNSLPLWIPSCSVQTIVQRLKKHLFISFSERMWGFSISDSLLLLLILKINTAHATMTFSSGARYIFLNHKQKAYQYLSKCWHQQTDLIFYKNTVKYICKAIKFITS